MIEVIPIKAFTDNYIWALVSKESVYVVDPGDSENFKAGQIVQLRKLRDENSVLKRKI